MKPEQLQTLIKYRMEQAYETIKEAEVFSKNSPDLDTLLLKRTGSL